MVDEDFLVIIIVFLNEDNRKMKICVEDDVEEFVKSGLGEVKEEIVLNDRKGKEVEV